MERKKQRVSRQAGTNHIKGRSYGIKNEGLRECYVYAFTQPSCPQTLAVSPVPSKDIRIVYPKKSEQTKVKDLKVLAKRMI